MGKRRNFLYPSHLFSRNNQLYFCCGISDKQGVIFKVEGSCLKGPIHRFLSLQGSYNPTFKDGVVLIRKGEYKDSHIWKRGISWKRVRVPKSLSIKGLKLALEDPRLFKWKGKLWAIVSTFIYNDKTHIRTSMALLNVNDPSKSTHLKYGRRKVEKNWIPIPIGEKLFFVYSINPFLLLSLEKDGRVKQAFKKKISNFPLDIRGSGIGFQFEGEIIYGGHIKRQNAFSPFIIRAHSTFPFLPFAINNLKHPMCQSFPLLRNPSLEAPSHKDNSTSFLRDLRTLSIAAWHKGASSSAYNLSNLLCVPFDGNYIPKKENSGKPILFWVRHPYSIITSAVSYHSLGKERWCRVAPKNRKERKIIRLHYPNPLSKTVSYAKEMKSRNQIGKFRFEMKQCSGVVIRNMHNAVKKMNNKSLVWRVEDGGNLEKVKRAARKIKEMSRSSVPLKNIECALTTKLHISKTKSLIMPAKAKQIFKEYFPKDILEDLGYKF